MAANQTIIEAAKAAYTKHNVDVSAQVAAMAAVSKGVIALAKSARDRLKKLNKAFNVSEDLKNKELLPWFKSIRNNKDLSQNQKIKIAKTFGEDDGVLETWSLDLQDKMENEELSKQIPATKSAWHSSIIDGSWFKTTHNIDLNNDGDTDDPGEQGLQPVIMDYSINRMKILNEKGEYVTVDNLDGVIETTIDSKDAKNTYTKFTKKSVMNGANINNIPTAVQNVQDELRDEFSVGGRKSMLSFAYDRSLRLNEHENMTFVEYFLENYLEGDEMDDYEYDTEGKIIDYDLLPEYQRIKIAYNKWIDGDDLNTKEKEELGRNLFRSIAGDDLENIDLEEELIEFIGIAAKYKLNTHLE